MINYKYKDAFTNYFYSTGGPRPCTYSRTQVTQQSKFKDLFGKTVLF